MRTSCLYCVRKHLSQAWVLRGECAQGYPQHRVLVIGHLAEAADEAAQRFPDLAKAIRKERLAYEKDKDYCPDFARLTKLLEKKMAAQGIQGLGAETKEQALTQLGSLAVFGLIGVGIVFFKTRKK